MADSAMPALDGVQWRPPSVDTATPPRKVAGSVRRNIFGRGRSCVPLKAPHIRSLTSGSNATQSTVFRNDRGTQVPDPTTVSPPSPLTNSPLPRPG